MAPGCRVPQYTYSPLPPYPICHPSLFRFEEPLANLLTEQHRTVKAQLEYLRMRKSMMKADEDKCPAREPETQRPPPTPKVPPVLTLDTMQTKRLQQQMQQVSRPPPPPSIHLLRCPAS